MDLLTTIIGLIVVALCVLPIVYMHVSQKKEKNKFLHDFKLMAEQQQLLLSKHEVWGHFYAIGLDSSCSKLCYYQKRGDRPQQELIKLGEVDRCWVNTLKKPMNGDNVIDRVELVLSFRNPKLAEKALVFYSREEGMALDGEIQLIELWKTIINSELANKKLAIAS